MNISRADVELGEDIKADGIAWTDKFDVGWAYCNFNKHLYFSGGQNLVGSFFYEVTILKIEKNAKTKLYPNMLFNHINHSIITNGIYLFAIGGYECKKCEYFHFGDNKWKEKPDLKSEERQRTMLLLHTNY